MKRRGVIQLVVAIVLALVSSYGFLWIWSSSHLAHDFCQGEFDLFHELPRCRQPYLALILAVVSCGLSAVLLFLGVRNVWYTPESGT